MPALDMFGAQWRAGRVDVAGEHVVSAIGAPPPGIELEAASRHRTAREWSSACPAVPTTSSASSPSA